jgi:uncharacterized protein YkwD/LysM repeat protein
MKAFRRSTFTRALLALFVALALLPAAGGPARPSAAQAGTPYQLLDEVNKLRAARGLAPYVAHDTLMAIAQAHSSYQASIGTVTHYSADGSRPRDRAYAAGYGGGATIFISENIAAGSSLSVQKVVEWWQGDDPHLNTMLGASYVHAGAGVAVVGDYVYYTLDVGWISGVSQPQPTAAPGTTPAAPAPPVATQPLNFPLPLLTTSTAAADGSIIHVVQSGQTLITIANSYGIPLADLMQLNSLTASSILHPGDELTIHRADRTMTPTPTETLTPTVTQTPRPTRTPRPRTETPRPSPANLELASALTLSPTPPARPPGANAGGDVLLSVVGVLVLAGMGLLVLGNYLKRSP